jgi:hypothetical protein
MFGAKKSCFSWQLETTETVVFIIILGIAHILKRALPGRIAFHLLILDDDVQ